MICKLLEIVLNKLYLINICGRIFLFCSFFVFLLLGIWVLFVYVLSYKVYRLLRWE